MSLQCGLGTCSFFCLKHFPWFHGLATFSSPFPVLQNDLCQSSALPWRQTYRAFPQA
jgi:hypothetical protein